MFDLGALSRSVPYRGCTLKCEGPNVALCAMSLETIFRYSALIKHECHYLGHQILRPHPYPRMPKSYNPSPPPLPQPQTLAFSTKLPFSACAFSRYMLDSASEC